ncbi:MAG: hypothetical protein CVV45_17425 [Spirochaetae bacterium HGW-Spirochaetae-10]|nr:MAG: hypothetical protein CVV45_17425 [Spirochaetae bacterium HGW-Spirochaetae-10]
MPFGRSTEERHLKYAASLPGRCLVSGEMLCRLRLLWLSGFGGLFFLRALLVIGSPIFLFELLLYLFSLFDDAVGRPEIDGLANAYTRVGVAIIKRGGR